MVLAADVSWLVRFPPFVFRGSFDGAGHTISGFAWLDEGSKVGLLPHTGRGGCRKKSDSGRGSGPWRLSRPGGILAVRTTAREHRAVTGDVTEMRTWAHW